MLWFSFLVITSQFSYKISFTTTNVTTLLNSVFSSHETRKSQSELLSINITNSYSQNAICLAGWCKCPWHRHVGSLASCKMQKRGMETCSRVPTQKLPRSTLAFLPFAHPPEILHCRFSRNILLSLRHADSFVANLSFLVDGNCCQICPSCIATGFGV